MYIKDNCIKLTEPISFPVGNLVPVGKTVATQLVNFCTFDIKT